MSDKLAYALRNLDHEDIDIIYKHLPFIKTLSHNRGTHVTPVSGRQQSLAEAFLLARDSFNLTHDSLRQKTKQIDLLTSAASLHSPKSSRPSSLQLPQGDYRYERLKEGLSRADRENIEKERQHPQSRAEIQHSHGSYGQTHQTKFQTSGQTDKRKGFENAISKPKFMTDDEDDEDDDIYEKEERQRGLRAAATAALASRVRSSSGKRKHLAVKSHLHSKSPQIHQHANPNHRVSDRSQSIPRHYNLSNSTSNNTSTTTISKGTDSAESSGILQDDGRSTISQRYDRQPQSNEQMFDEIPPEAVISGSQYSQTRYSRQRRPSLRPGLYQYGDPNRRSLSTPDLSSGRTGSRHPYATGLGIDETTLGETPYGTPYTEVISPALHPGAIPDVPQIPAIYESFATPPQEAQSTPQHNKGRFPKTDAILLKHKNNPDKTAAAAIGPPDVSVDATGNIADPPPEITAAGPAASSSSSSSRLPWRKRSKRSGADDEERQITSDLSLQDQIRIAPIMAASISTPELGSSSRDEGRDYVTGDSTRHHRHMHHHETKMRDPRRSRSHEHIKRKRRRRRLVPEYLNRQLPPTPTTAARQAAAAKQRTQGAATSLGISRPSNLGDRSENISDRQILFTMPPPIDPYDPSRDYLPHYLRRTYNYWRWTLRTPLHNIPQRYSAWIILHLKHNTLWYNIQSVSSLADDGHFADSEEVNAYILQRSTGHIKLQEELARFEFNQLQQPDKVPVIIFNSSFLRIFNKIRHFYHPDRLAVQYYDRLSPKIRNRLNINFFEHYAVPTKKIKLIESSARSKIPQPVGASEINPVSNAAAGPSKKSKSKLRANPDEANARIPRDNTNSSLVHLQGVPVDGTDDNNIGNREQEETSPLNRVTYQANPDFWHPSASRISPEKRFITIEALMIAAEQADDTHLPMSAIQPSKSTSFLSQLFSGRSRN